MPRSNDLLRIGQRLRQYLDRIYAPHPVQTIGIVDSVERSSDGKLITGARVNVGGQVDPLLISLGSAIHKGDKVLVQRLGGALGPQWQLVAVIESSLPFGVALDAAAVAPAAPPAPHVTGNAFYDGDPATIDAVTIRVSFSRTYSSQPRDLDLITYVIQWRPIGSSEWRTQLSRVYLAGEVDFLEEIPGAMSGTVYQIRIAARDFRGLQSDWSPIVTFSQITDSNPHQIASITATKIQGAMRISWTPSTIVGVAGYRVYAANDASGAGATPVAFIPGPYGSSGTLFYDAGDLSKWYAVRCTLDSGVPFTTFTAWVKDETPPPLPSGFTVDQRQTGALLQWPRDSFLTFPNFDHFEIVRTTASGGTPTATMVTTDDHLLFPSTSGSGNWYGLRAVDQQGAASAYRWAKDDTPPPVPTGLTIVEQPNAITLVWNYSSDPGLKEHRIYISQSMDGSSASFVGATPAFNFTLPISPTTARYFAVSAVDWSGNESARTAFLPGHVVPPGMDNLIVDGDFLSGGGAWTDGASQSPNIYFWSLTKATGWNAPAPELHVELQQVLDLSTGELAQYIPVGRGLTPGSTYSVGARVRSLSTSGSAQIEVVAYSPTLIPLGSAATTVAASALNLTSGSQSLVAVEGFIIPSGSKWVGVFLRALASGKFAFAEVRVNPNGINPMWIPYSGQPYMAYNTRFPLLNPGFQDDTSGWTLSGAAVRVTSMPSPAPDYWTTGVKLPAGASGSTIVSDQTLSYTYTIINASSGQVVELPVPYLTAQAYIYVDAPLQAPISWGQPYQFDVSIRFLIPGPVHTHRFGQGRNLRRGSWELISVAISPEILAQQYGFVSPNIEVSSGLNQYDVYVTSFRYAHGLSFERTS